MHYPLAQSRRDFLYGAGGGLGGVALSWLAARDARAGEKVSAVNPFAAKLPHHEPKAKSIIFMFMVGGPSPLDLFDPKPALTKHDVYVADECFLTGTAAEIVPVVRVDDRLIGDGKPGPVTKDLTKRFHALVRG